MEAYQRFCQTLANAVERGRMPMYQIIVFLIMRYGMEVQLGLVPGNTRSIKNRVNTFRRRINAEPNLTHRQKNNLHHRLNSMNNFANNRRRLNAPASPAHSST